MHPIIEKVKNKAEELNVSDLHDVLIDGYLSKEAPNPDDDWYKKHPEYLAQEIKNFEFDEFLRSLNFKVLDQSGGGEGGAEACHCVIELEGQPFRLDYSYYSYAGYEIDDIWDWNLVVPKQKTITVYE